MINKLGLILLYALLAFLGYIIWLVLSPCSIECKIQLPEYYDQETSLLCNILQDTEESFAHKLGLHHSGGRRIYSSTICKLGPVYSIFGRRIELQEARKIAFEVIQNYRKFLTEDERSRIFYRARRPDYNLQEQLFPLERIYIVIKFRDELKINFYLEPYIAYVLFEDGEFYYYVSEDNSKDCKLIFKEAFEEAKKFYYSENTQISDRASSYSHPYLHNES